MYTQALKETLAGLMRRYKERVSDVQLIINQMLAQGLIEKEDDIVNDHIAFSIWSQAFRINYWHKFLKHMVIPGVTIMNLKQKS